MEHIYISKLNIWDTVWSITASEQGVTGIYPSDMEIPIRENAVTVQAAAELREYAEQGRREFTFPLDLRGTPFRKRVWEALLCVPYGETSTYGQIAAAIGRPKAARAVGQAIGKNPCLIVVPCHRILGGNGSLTGFSAGMDWKKRFLDLEGIAYETERGRKT